MSNLTTYLQSNIVQVLADDAQDEAPIADMIFFRIKAKPEANAEEFKKALAEHQGVFCSCNLFDKEEHNYMELGGWVGDQTMALGMMGLGSLLGLWKLLTPITVLGDLVPKEMIMRHLPCIEWRYSKMCSVIKYLDC